MGLHRPFTRGLFLQNGNVLTSGGSGNLAKGQFAIVDIKTGTSKGAKVVSDFAGVSRDAQFEFRVGKHNVANTRSAQNNKPYASLPFKLQNVEEIYVSAPKTMEQKFDDVIIGYDGINDSTALTFEDGDETVLDIILKGDPIGYLGQHCEYFFKMHFGKIDGQTNQEVVEAAVERAKKLTLPTGVSILNYVDISAVDSANAGLAGVPYAFSTLTVSDEGTSNDLANVQAQYPDYRVVKSDRVGVDTTYTILHPTSVGLAPYSTTLPSYIKGCEDCAVGYAELEAGVVYSIHIEDDGVDVTTSIYDVPGFVTGSVVKQGQKEGVGLYTVVVDNELTDAEITAFLAANALKSTASFKLLGDVTAVCESSAETVATAWSVKETCFATAEAYTIQLKDNECGESRLAELQKAFPNLTIVEGVASGNATQTVTVSSDVALAIIVDGVTYTTADAGTTSQTAAAFVVQHAAAILAATGTVVTNPATNSLVFTDAVLGFPTITSAAQTVGAVTLAVTASVGGCQRVYSTSVVTNVVCDECDDIFLDNFISEAPNDFDFVSWNKVASTSNENAKMGIRITAKPFILSPDEWLKDEVPFYETSVEIKVAGGYSEEFNYSTPNYNSNFAVKILSRKEDRDHLGYNFLALEDESRAYFDGTIRHKGNNFAKALLGEESVLDFRKQYVTYGVTIKDNGYSQSLGSSIDTANTYLIVVEVGRHNAVEALLNEIAAKSGLDAVQAFAN